MTNEIHINEFKPFKFLRALDKKGYNCTVSCQKVNGVEEYSVETYWKDLGQLNEDKSHFCELTDEAQKKAIVWLLYNLIPSKTVCRRITSYGLKHILEDRVRLYMTNNQFKEAMLQCGFYPSDPDTVNWTFYIKKSSPIFQCQVDKKPGLPMMGDPMDYSSKQTGINASAEDTQDAV